MEKRFVNTDFRECYIQLSKGHLEQAIYLLENHAYGIFGDIQANIIKLLKQEEIIDFSWYSNEKHEQTKIETIGALCNLAEALKMGGFDMALKQPVYDFLHLMIWDFGKEIEELIEDKTSGASAGLVWMDGSKLRLWSKYMADLYHREGLEDFRLDMLVIRAVITNAIMPNEHNEVAPTMMAVSNLYKERGNFVSADRFCNGVLEDFDFLVDEYYKTGKDIKEKDVFTLKALKNACENKREMGVANLDLDLLANKLDELV